MRNSTSTSAPAAERPGFADRYGVDPRRRSQPVRRRTASPFPTGDDSRDRADRSIAGVIRFLAGRPGSSRICPRAMNRSTGSSWTRFPSGAVVPRSIDVGARVGDHEQRLRNEPVDLPRRPLRERGLRVPGEHLRVRPDLLGQVDDLAKPNGGGHRLLGKGNERLQDTDCAVRPRSLEELNAVVVRCRRCPRLVKYREAVAREKRAAFRDWAYWGRPVPGFGAPHARLLIIGLAPAA